MRKLTKKDAAAALIFAAGVLCCWGAARLAELVLTAIGAGR